jgi:transposase
MFSRSFPKQSPLGFPPELLHVAPAPLLKQIEVVNEAVREYDRQIEQIAATQYPETYLLKQIEGVGTLISLTYVLTLEDSHRFSKSRDVGAFLGSCHGKNNRENERPGSVSVERAMST